MILDAIIVLLYFVVVMAMALRGKQGKDVTTEEYFLSSRNLRWPSIAISTIATNVQGYQFLGMMGSAYLYGLAQGILEINAVQGLLMAAFIFVPLYLKDRVITITQFIKKRLGETVGLFYSCANLLLFSTIGLGAALFWGAYAADLVFADYLSFISDSRLVRTCVLVIALGVFSAVYTYLGGLAAVVKTDIIQFTILVIGGTVVLFASVQHLGGWEVLYQKPNLLMWGDDCVEVDHLMHLHLPADHPKLPWTAMLGLFFLNINYWCANQTVIQRSLAARSLKDAQIGLMVGGVMKYFMAIIIIVPGIALAGILGVDGLAEPDQTFPYLVTHYLPTGLRGLILCALFASLMSTVDSTFNSLATLFSIDIYKCYINKEATDAQIVQAGRNTILVTLVTGVTMGCYLLYMKLNNPTDAFTHTLNELRYYVNCGIVVFICTAAFLLAPKKWLVLLAFIITIPLNIFIKGYFPDLNYFVRALWVILAGLTVVGLPTLITNGGRFPLEFANKRMLWYAIALFASLVGIHILFS